MQTNAIATSPMPQGVDLINIQVINHLKKKSFKMQPDFYDKLNKIQDTYKHLYDPRGRGFLS